MARPTISLQAAIGTTVLPSNPFIIGTSLLGGTDVLIDYYLANQQTWAEIGDYCYTVSTRRGRQRFLEQFAAGTLAAELDNSDRRFDPTWLAGPYVTSGRSNITEGIPVRLLATYSGVEYSLYYGFADDWSPIYRYPEGGGSSLTATDAFKIFKNNNPTEQSAQGAGELTGARVTRILNFAGWDSVQRDIQSGQATHNATTLASPIITQLRLAVDSERGDIYMSGDGRVTFRNRGARLTDARSRYVQYQFGDRAGMLNPARFATTNNDELKKNDVRVARAGGTQVVRQSAEAIATPWKARTYNRTDLTLADDGQVVDYADWVLNLFSEQTPRVDWVEFEPDGYDELWPVVLGAQFGDRVTVDLTHPYDGSVWTGEYFIEGVDHTIPVLQDGKWRTRFYLADASRFPTNAFIVGVSLLGGVDVLV